MDVPHSWTAARAAARIAALKLTHAFYTWRRASTAAAIWRESAQAQALLAQAQRLVRNRTRRHFHAWLGYLISLRQEWVAEEYMLESTTLKAFVAWVGTVERSNALREGMMSLYLRRAMHLLRVSLEQLAQHSAARRYRRAQLARATRWRHRRTLHIVWIRWEELACQSGHSDRRARLLLRRWKLRLASSALRRWIEWRQLRRRMALIVALLQGKRTESNAFMVLDRWRQYAARGRRNTHALARAAFAIRRSLVRRAWNSWNDLSRLQLSRRRKMLASLYRRQQYAGFHGWLDYCCSREEQRRKLGKAVACMIRGHMAAAWRGWLTFTHKSVHNRRTLQRVLSSMLNTRLHRALAAWAGAVFTARATRSVREVQMRRALAKLMQRLLVLSWEEWKAR
jgi:hypothetical protein